MRAVPAAASEKLLPRRRFLARGRGVQSAAVQNSPERPQKDVPGCLRLGGPCGHFLRAQTISIIGRRISSFMPGMPSMCSGGLGSTTRVISKPFVSSPSR